MTNWQFFKIQASPNLKKIKKTFQRMFKDKGLDIIINYNMKIVNYLDVTLNLNDGSYRPYLIVRQSKQKLVSSFCS